MIICVGCRTEMKCEKNGVGADFGNGHVYNSDRYWCRSCGATVMVTVRTPMHDPDYKSCGEYLIMNIEANEKG